MPKYLFHGSYTTEGTKGLLRDGGSKRQAAVAELAKSVGGKLEGFYFAFGESDIFVIVDMPDSASVAAVSLAVNGSGLAQIKTTVLLTPEEMDAATKKTVSYHPPGQ